MIFDFKCKECGFQNEYMFGQSLPKEMQKPDKCPKCGGAMEQLFSPQGGSFDIIGTCYTNDYGKKAWKKNLSISEQAKVLSGERSPY